MTDVYLLTKSSTYLLTNVTYVAQIRTSRKCATTCQHQTVMYSLYSRKWSEMSLFTTDGAARHEQLHYSFILPGHSVQMRVRIRDDQRRQHQRTGQDVWMTGCLSAFADRHPVNK